MSSNHFISIGLPYNAVNYYVNFLLSGLGGEGHLNSWSLRHGEYQKGQGECVVSKGGNKLLGSNN